MSSYPHLQEVDAYLTNIIGVRILKNNQILHIFADENWKDSARITLPLYVGQPDISFDTLHRFKPFSNLPNEVKERPFWLHNPYFGLSSLF